uniref:Uncharacterized protein n=1 Tax=Picea glauca TaxID=3330 RepID=A0A117NH52_PICGL|nr:hypothetical protein ABT39_MTgene4822 [Picea glauca]QHR88756.1 hypothetical protein Q903MT_gene2770 [Picea sitchensis]
MLRTTEGSGKAFLMRSQPGMEFPSFHSSSRLLALTHGRMNYIYSC